MWDKIKSWAMTPLLGVPAFVYCGAALAGAYLLFFKNSTGRRGGLFRR